MPKWNKVTKGNQKGATREPQGAKRVPQRCQKAAKLFQMHPNGTQQFAKGCQKIKRATKINPKLLLNGMRDRDRQLSTNVTNNDPPKTHKLSRKQIRKYSNADFV